MALLMVAPWAPQSEYGRMWSARIRERMPGIDLRHFPDELGDKAEIDAALAWLPPPGLLASLPNLKLIHSLGMGVDSVLSDPELPVGVPVARVVDDDLIQRMSEYCLHALLHYHRDADRYDRDKAARRWDPAMAPHARERRIGIMGLGELGRDLAAKLVALQFDVAGWSRTPKDVAGVESFHGADGFEPFLARSEYVVCLLPLTPETEGILDARAFAAMPKGGGIVNAARGGHVVDADLIAALDAGQLAFAKLDVFREEPLPPEHPFWAHPRIRITPHNAGITNPATAVDQILENYRRALAGEPILNLVDTSRGY